MLLETLLLALTLPLLSLAAQPKNAILLSKVRTLTLRGNGAKTASRRVAPVPQLKCISSKAVCDLFQIDVMRCTNQGSSYGTEDIEWSCSASLPEEFKLGSTDVICEGYASSDDPYVLKGSCGVEYRLILTDKGEQRYPDVANPNGRWFSDGEGGTDLGAWVFAVIFFAVLGWIVYSAWRNGTNPDRRVPGGRGYGGGGGGGGGGGWGPGWGPGNDPPPPYPGTKPDDTQQGWRPGFWSGLAGGAAAGYMAGNRNNRREERYPTRGWGAGPSGSQPSSFGSGSSSSSNSSRYESTGFGSTRRR
ncbi:Store-operated calcium entry-associated regulatory factor [Trichoderma simmonsii]|uniref:Store-operated calcium entry-associated regulatory factor n=1 Tax=Trichoderma simmonsii TaxID=1491479 RepID=A0A8G0PFZ9_9HYPO|nr:Store-operated calcium entry-associated regulatory factor [Trichoderma simmonsii]